MMANSQSLWPNASTVSLDGPVKPGFTTSIRRRRSLCRWTTQEIYELFDLLIDDMFHSKEGRTRNVYDIMVGIFFMTQYSGNIPRASMARPLGD